MANTAALCGQMCDLMIGHWKSQFLAVAAQLGIADLLHEQPMTSDELAKKTNCHPNSLFRLLRALESMGIFIKNTENKCELTPLGSTLRNGIFRHVVFLLASDTYEVMTNLLYCIKTGEDGYKNKYGISYYDNLKNVAAQPDDTEFQNFRQAHHEATVCINGNIPSYYDFNQFKHIIDCGGNDGAFLVTILKQTPNAKGTVFDEGPAIEEAKKNIVKNGLTDRITGITGNFLESVPAGGDCYILKSVLPDWSEDAATKILKNIRQRMTQKSKLLLINSVVPEDCSQHPGKFFDVFYLVCTHGMERTRTELDQILKKAGMKVYKVIPTDYPIYSIVEAVLE